MESPNKKSFYDCQAALFDLAADFSFFDSYCIFRLAAKIYNFLLLSLPSFVPFLPRPLLPVPSFLEFSFDIPRTWSLLRSQVPFSPPLSLFSLSLSLCVFANSCLQHPNVTFFRRQPHLSFCIITHLFRRCIFFFSPEEVVDHLH